MSPESFAGKDNDKLSLPQILEKYGEVLVSAHGTVMKLSETPEKCEPFVNALLNAESYGMQEQIIEIYRVERS